MSEKTTLDAFRTYVRALDEGFDPEVVTTSYADGECTLEVHIYACEGYYMTGGAQGVCRSRINNEGYIGPWTEPVLLRDFLEECDGNSSPLHRWILPEIIARVDQIEAEHAELRRIAAMEFES